MDQDESFNIDIERYLFALRKWRRFIIFTTLIGGVLALGFSFLSSPAYESEAVIAIVKSGMQINFDPKFTTVSDANNTAYVDPTARRKSLTTIATSPEIASAVLSRIGVQLPPVSGPTGLAAAIKATNDGDLIKIKASAATSNAAALLANTWADEYTTRVNAVYGENSISTDEIQTQATGAKKDYDTKEAALINYFATDPSDKLTKQISETRQLLSSFRDVEINTRVTAVDTDYNIKLAAFKAYADNLIKTRVAAFEKEQEAKTQLFDIYSRVEVSSTAAVISKQFDARMAQLTEYYDEQQKLQRLSVEAKSLRDRVQSGGSASRSSATANSLALILLQASAFTTGANLPVDLQVPMDQLTDLNSTPDQQLRDLNLLIEILDSKLRDTNRNIDQMSRALQNSDGYQLLPITTTAGSPIRQALKQKYDAMLQVGDLAKYSDTAVFDSDLSNGLLQKYNELFVVGELSKVAAMTPPTSTAAASSNEVTTKLQDQLQQQLNGLQSQLEAENAKRQELTRARDLAWSTYTTLATKTAEMGVAAQATGSIVRIATLGVAPTTSSETGKATKTLIGLMVGLLLGVGVAFGSAFVRTTVRNEDQVNRLLGLTVLGAIPEIVPERQPKNNGGEKNNLSETTMNLAVLDPRSPAMEAYRVLRHNFLSLTPSCRVVVITSAMPSEGKSTIAANLAAITAQAGRRVILVDAEFRRPSQHELFNVKNNRGLNDILSGAVENWETFAQATPIENLKLVTTGALPPDPAILLESPELKRWLDLVEPSADFVIIDTPPSIGLADVLIAARAADATLLVVGSDMVSERDAVRAKELFASSPAPIVGVVLNRIDEMSSAMIYASYYASRKDSQKASTAKTSVPQVQPLAFDQLRDRFMNYILPHKHG